MKSNYKDKTRREKELSIYGQQLTSQSSIFFILFAKGSAQWCKEGGRDIFERGDERTVSYRREPIDLCHGNQKVPITVVHHDKILLNLSIQSIRSLYSKKSSDTIFVVKCKLSHLRQEETLLPFAIPCGLRLCTHRTPNDDYL